MPIKRNRLSNNRKLLACYLPIGDPQMLPAQVGIYFDCGVDIFEVGIPSPDPHLDGADADPASDYDTIELMSPDIDDDDVRRARNATGYVMLGFGISKPEHASQAVARGNDGVVIGSACIAAAKQGVAELTAFLSVTREALDGA